jgi:hypothetical protein
MRFLKFALHHQDAGALVETALSGVQSKVYVVDDANLHRMERGESFRHATGGGLYRSSPARIRIPSAGNWTAVVIPIGGRVTASVRVIARKVVSRAVG